MVSLSIAYAILKTYIQYLVNLIDKHGVSILRKDKSHYNLPMLKEEITNQVRDRLSVILYVSLQIKASVWYNYHIE